jgi:type VI secretion system secreted protein VgrG
MAGGANTLTQDGRPIKVKTPLGKDVLLLEQFDGKESISQPYEFHLHMVSLSKSLDIEALIRKPVTLYYQLPDDKMKYRYINGLCRGARMLELDMGLTTYQLEMVPWLWFLTQRTNCRHFQKKNVQEILEIVFKEHSEAKFKFALTKSYKKRDFCVQYRETDFNFVSRMMEEEGIYYYWEHTEDTHTMVLTDSKGQIKQMPHQNKIKFAYQAFPEHPEDFIHTVDFERNYRAGKLYLKEYDFTLQEASRHPFEQTSGKYSQSEKYDYPGYNWNGPGMNKYVRDWLEMEEWPQKLIRGVSSVRSFSPGYKFTLSEHFNSQVNGDWLLLTVYHRAEGNNYRSELEEPFRYTNSYEAIPANIDYRPPRMAIKPTIKGTQSAIVVGPPGEHIYPDKYGRVKVQFPWDREGKFDDKSSCWIRVSQSWAGGSWGWITIPRVGQEVIVSFQEGDPDRPIITGRAYNEVTKVPYKLPDCKTASTWMSSNEYKAKSGFHEIRFDDNKGKEQLFIHCEKDRDDRTKNIMREWVGADRHLIVGGKQIEKIGSDKELKIGGNQKEKIAAKYSLNVGTNYHIKVGQNYALDAGMEVHIKGGMKVIIEAGMQATMKGPGGFVNIDPSGVQIQGTMVLINSGGAAGSGSGSQPDDPQDAKEADPNRDNFGGLTRN